MIETPLPPLMLPPPNATHAQKECYLKAGNHYIIGILDCLAEGGTSQEIQDCITGKHNLYIASLGICDTL